MIRGDKKPADGMAILYRGKSMGDSFTNLVFHLVFSTKDRIPLIRDEFRGSLYEYIGGIIRGQRGTLLEIGGMPDHVHLLARFRASASVSTMIRFIKCNSTLWRNGQATFKEELIVLLRKNGLSFEERHLL